MNACVHISARERYTLVLPLNVVPGHGNGTQIFARHQQKAMFSLNGAYLHHDI